MQVIQKLRTLFTGYSEMPPTCFVFCGHFTTRPYGTDHIRVLKGICDFHICSDTGFMPMCVIMPFIMKDMATSCLLNFCLVARVLASEG